MKVFGKLLRSVLAPVFGVAAMGVLLTGCGDSTDPTAVGLDELKFSNGLHIVDQGNGTVRLIWSGSNNEDGFSGYNIYGAKGDTLAADEGKAIKLLDDKGEPDQAGKDKLATMGYNGKDWETVGPSTNADGDFAIYPYYKTINGTDAVLPSCMPNKNEGDDSTCTALEAEGAASHIFNGKTHFDVTGLKIGSNYCFTTLATLDGGKKVAQTTSEIRCVVPRASTDVATATADKDKSYGLDLEALRVACDVDGGTKCGTFAQSTDLRVATTTSFAEDNTKGCNEETSKALCIEYFGVTTADPQGGKANFTAGKNTGVQDLGYYPLGFDDPTLPKAPSLSSFSSLQNKDGYSVAGQSLPLEDNHVYVVAYGTTDDPKSFYYHYIFVSGMTNNKTAQATFKMTVRTSNKTDSL